MNASIQVHANGKKGRRQCPALNGWISAKDCGEYRLREIRCPADCRYLDAHGRYQHARVADDFHLAWIGKVAPYYQQRDQLALDFLMDFEFALYRHVRAHPVTTDEQVREALRVLVRQLSPIQVFEAMASSLAKQLLQATQEFQKQQPRLDAEKAQRVVEDVLALFAKVRADERGSVSSFMGHVEAHFKVPAKEDETQIPNAAPQIITPR
ncbi:MAG TPA: hypothetical protein VIL47_02545 [Candidatus Bipolaricaulota bacterium]